MSELTDAQLEHARDIASEAIPVVMVPVTLYRELVADAEALRERETRTSEEVRISDELRRIISGLEEELERLGSEKDERIAELEGQLEAERSERQAIGEERDHYMTVAARRWQRLQAIGALTTDLHEDSKGSP